MLMRVILIFSKYNYEFEVLSDHFIKFQTITFLKQLQLSYMFGVHWRPTVSYNRKEEMNNNGNEQDNNIQNAIIQI